MRKTTLCTVVWCVLIGGSAVVVAEEPLQPSGDASEPTDAKKAVDQPTSAEDKPPPEIAKPAATNESVATKDSLEAPVDGDELEEAPTDGEKAPTGWGDLGQVEQKLFETRIYGYIDSYWEKVANTPAGVDGSGNTIKEANPYEFDVLNLTVMAQGLIQGKYRFFLNLAAPGSGSNTGDEGIAVRNAWVEAPILGDRLQIRAGKTYRRFGLYNEILDATPTFIGIEAPELFDKDHLMVTRTTSLMLHGVESFDENSITWALMTGNDERASGSIPVGFDIYADFGVNYRIGSSLYWSGGDASPTRSVGDGSPRGGVANWMARDEYYVFGGYGQIMKDGLTLQAEYWQANHSATRDPAQVMALVGGGLNPRQLERFFVDGDPSMGLQDLDVDYTVRTFYLRGGYDIPLGGKAVITPYAQADYYENPETVASKDLGGDNEAGLSDDGKFWKFTAGVVYRPVPQVALKIDGSGHLQDFNGAAEFYPEVRVSFSYLWQLDL